MATITVYGGDFKAGRGVYEFKKFRLKSYRQPFLAEVISLDHLAKLETVSLENNGRDTLSTAGRALVGELIAGPFGALVAAGTAKGRNQVTFHATFDDSRQFLGATNSETFKAWMGALLTRQRMGENKAARAIGGSDPVSQRARFAIMAFVVGMMAFGVMRSILGGGTESPKTPQLQAGQKLQQQQQASAAPAKMTEAEIDAECNSVSDPIPNCKEELPKLLAKQAALPKLAPEPQDKGESNSGYEPACPLTLPIDELQACHYRTNPTSDPAELERRADSLADTSRFMKEQGWR